MTTLALGSRRRRQEAAALDDVKRCSTKTKLAPSVQLFALTVVSEQSLSRALALGAGGFRAATAVEADAAVGAAVAPCPVAPVYAPLEPRQRCRLSTCRIRLMSAWLKKKSQRTTDKLCLTVSVWAPMDSSRAES